jgi:regulation of enolase protein 1 (concanavalin A-like superfamily)
MHWHNEPAHWQTADGELRVTADPHTDFWRQTHYGFSRDNGHFYYQVASGDFQLDVQVRGRYAAPRDQAGLMLRIDDRNWLKFGVEFVRGMLQVSAVATREVSDESLLPLPDSPPEVWLRLLRRNEGVELFFSRDGRVYSRVRIAYFPPVATVQAWQGNRIKI